jgi:hypothetical protein
MALRAIGSSLAPLREAGLLGRQQLDHQTILASIIRRKEVMSLIVLCPVTHADPPSFNRQRLESPEWPTAKTSGFDTTDVGIKGEIFRNNDADDARGALPSGAC